MMLKKHKCIQNFKNAFGKINILNFTIFSLFLMTVSLVKSSPPTPADFKLLVLTDDAEQQGVGLETLSFGNVKKITWASAADKKWDGKIAVFLADFFNNKKTGHDAISEEMGSVHRSLKKIFDSTSLPVYVAGINMLFDIFHKDLLPVMLTLSNIRALTDNLLSLPDDAGNDDKTNALIWLDKDKQLANIIEDLELKVAEMHVKCGQHFEKLMAFHIGKSYYPLLQIMTPGFNHPCSRLIEIYGQIM